MPYTSGTATDHNDLLAKLRTWLTGLSSPWTSLSYSAGATPADPSTLYLEGPGAGVGARVHVNIRTSYDASVPTWCWEMVGATDYDSGSSWASQPNVSPSVFVNLNASSQAYWFYANDRHFTIVSAVDGSKYCSAYAGFCLPYATPSEYPHPLYIAGMYSAKAISSYDNAGNRFFIDPGYGAAYVLGRSPLSWRAVANNEHQSSAGISWTGNEAAIVWPHRSRRAVSTSFTYLSDWSQNGIAALRPNANGERMLWQAQIIDTTGTPGKLIGALDGAFAVPGFGLTATQAITVSGRSFRVFPNISRSGTRDFMAIEEVA